MATRFIRPMLAPVFSDNSISRRISELTDHPGEISEHGVPLDELYVQLNAMAHFIRDVRVSILPNMSSVSGFKNADDPQKIFRDMALSNFRANMDLLAQYTTELFDAVVAYDKRTSKAGKALFTRIPENSETVKLLQKG